MSRVLAFSALAVALISAHGIAATKSDVFQYSVQGTTVEGKALTAFLWVPPEANHIRGVLVGGTTLMEPAFATDPIIRKVCADEQLAIVLMSPSVDAVFNYKEKGAGEALQKILDDLATASGYREICVASLFSYGHSVSSIFAGNVAYWKPERCFGVLAFKGGLGSMGSDQNASISGVPVLCVKGQFEEFGPGPSGVLRENEDREASWRGMRAGMLERRKKDPNAFVSLLVEAGAGHFAWSARVSDYVASFIRKAARARIPEWPIDTQAPVVCLSIKPESGALTNSEIVVPGELGDKAAVAYANFKGDTSNAFWHLDLELARAHDAFHGRVFEKQPQFVTFADVKSGKPFFVGHDLRLKLKPEWSGPDTFKVAGVFLDKAPDKYPKVDVPVGHAESPLQFRVFGGAAEQIGPNEFRVGMNAIGKIRAEILAYHPGDGKYRYAEQQGRVTLPEKLTAGKAQKIVFAPLGTLKQSALPAKLSAASDAELPVRFYVESGSAFIADGELKLSEIPKRSAWPLRVVVVAYQYGSAVAPLVQSAEPVKLEVLIDK